MNSTSIMLATILLFSLSSHVYAIPPLQSTVETSSQGLSNSQENSLYYSNRASIKFLKKDTQGAIIDFDKAIELDSKNPNLYLNTGDK